MHDEIKGGGRLATSKVQPPSIYDWIKKGSISKDKLPELWRFFSDVVGPEHWGLNEYPIPTPSTSDTKSELLDINSLYQAASDEIKAIAFSSYLEMLQSLH